MSGDTPETDAAQHEGLLKTNPIPMQVVTANFARKLERERDEAREVLREIEDKMRVQLRGHPDSELWGEAGLIAATMRCVDALDVVTEQRDEAREIAARLAHFLERPAYSVDEAIARMEALNSYKKLKSK